MAVDRLFHAIGRDDANIVIPGRAKREPGIHNAGVAQKTPASRIISNAVRMDSGLATYGRAPE
jgi:hypothetical protein